MRGFFGIGVEGISKEQNVGTIARSAHAFGASFFFTINPEINVRAIKKTDTSGAFEHLPYYQYEKVDQMQLPRGCKIVGIELTDEAIELPSFRHPSKALYILGPEAGSLSDKVQEKCDFIIKIPMKFCVNVGIASAIVMYDRMLQMGSFAPMPVRAGAPTEDKPAPVKSYRRKVRTRKQDL